ncbi:phosphoglycerate mutase family protein [Oricola sp.]|uniref:SixA phosphatase family protein n=1 Tax=Oricola sp. TaxID=1979950 RepID=UPI0025E12765|nr:phosphoglycerate mutase family protein [Oricola sp.]MCI5074344.1 histidine phosphatase family protein [Oricola sp.]
MLRIVVAAAISAAATHPVPVHTQEAVYIIRHAEKETADQDPPLTAEGRDRAAKWAQMLRRADIDVVITSDARRTRETGGIIAEELDVPQTRLPANDVSGLVDLIQFDHEEDTVLVVGHAEIIPSIVSALGVAEPVVVSQDDFANLFVVTGNAEGMPRMIRLIMP